MTLTSTLRLFLDMFVNLSCFECRQGQFLSLILMKQSSIENEKTKMKPNYYFLFGL